MMKKIDKRACRKAFDPQLRFHRNNGLLHCESIKYVIRTAVKNISGTRTLLLHLYDVKQVASGLFVPTFTVFQTKDDFITMRLCQDGTVKWLTSNTNGLDRDYHFSKKCAFYTPTDENTVVKYCSNRWDKGMESLSGLQRRIKGCKETERKHAKERIIIKRMEGIPCIPRDLKGFIHREAAPQYIFYDYQRTAKPIDGYCTACKHTVQVVGAKHNTIGVCPRCKKDIVFKSRGKRGYFHDRGTVQTLQRMSDNEIILRYYKFYYTYSRKDVPEIRVYENARVFITWENVRDPQDEWYYHSYNCGDLTPWKRGKRPCRNKYFDSFESDCTAFLYHRNLDEVLDGTPWKYSQLKLYYLSDAVPMCIFNYLSAYIKHPFLEYLVKLKLYNLATYVAYTMSNDYGSKKALNCDGKNLEEVLGMGKVHLPLLQGVNPGGGQLKMIREMVRQGIVPNIELLRWCTKFDVTQSRKILMPLKFMTPHKLMIYAEEQFRKFRRRSYYDKGKFYYDMSALLTDYCDYLVMCDGLDYDLKNDFVLFPRQLPEAHDKVNDLSDKETSAAYDNQIAKAFAEMQQRYQFKEAGYMIVPPHSSKEIVEEGHKLHHCVGTYVKKVVKQDCVILFVRREDKPDEPFCTVEVIDGDVNQARCYKNQDPPPGVKGFLSLWKQKVLYAPLMDKAA